ncbi:MAG: hypothetical protein NZ898_15000 [Myxococcota bacterium]|nr:hypothetical protein [Myxococcota bacterium]MDW8360948.1 hypothetical protein [Myxococcales bacterium]
MIADDIRIDGFDARSWTNLLSLFSPRLQVTDAGEAGPEPPQPAREASGTLVVVVDAQGRVLAALGSRRGRIDDVESADDLAALRERYGVRRVVVLREGVLEEIVERLALRVRRDDDYVAQWLALARIVREMTDAGLVRVHPRRWAGLPIPTAATVRRAVDVVLPDERAAVFTLWDGPQPWTAVVIRRRRGCIDRLAGPESLLRWTGPLGGDWRRDHRVIEEAVTRSCAPVHVGLYAEAHTFRRLLARPTAGHWALAVATRDLIVHPMPPYVSVALAADAARAATTRARRWGPTAGLFDAAGTLLSAVRARLPEVASITEILGFDPLRALEALQRREP